MPNNETVTGYHFYIQPTDEYGEAVGTTVFDLEEDFPGLKYASCTGLAAVGKPKNIYSENYPEADGLRTYHPSDITGGVVHHEATDVELTLVFIGDGRRNTYHEFCDVIRSARFLYWDNARNRKAWLMLTEEVAPTDDTLKQVKYMRATFKFKNLWGMTRLATESDDE